MNDVSDADLLPDPERLLADWKRLRSENAPLWERLEAGDASRGVERESIEDDQSMNTAFSTARRRVRTEVKGPKSELKTSKSEPDGPVFPPEVLALIGLELEPGTKSL
jgi:hypothetical protein